MYIDSAEEGLTLHTGYLAYFLLSADFFQNQLFAKLFQEYHQSVKQLGSRSGPTFCRAWCGSRPFA